MAKHLPFLKNPNWSTLTLYFLVGMGVVVRLFLIYSIGLFQEDALITLRYAKNLWDGLGFVYNPSEHVLGATSPLWVVLTSPLVGLLTYSVASKLIALLGLGFFSGAQIISLQLTAVWKWSFAARFLLLSILSLHPTLVAFSVSGMEAPLFLLLMLGSLHELYARRFIVSFVLIGLSVLARPEGVIWFACVIIYFIWYERRIPWRESIVMIFVLVPWVSFAWHYFGSPIPQSAIAKSNWISNQITLLDLVWRPVSWFSKWVGFGGISFPSLPMSVQVVIAVAWTAFFFAGVIIAIYRHHGVVLLSAGFFVAYVSFYYFGNARVFEWYWLPGIAMAAFAVALSLGNLSDVVLDRLLRPDLGNKIVFWGQVLVLGSAFIVLFALFVYKVDGFRIDQNYQETVRRPLGEYLARCSDPQATVMLEPLGYIGYFSERRMIDLAGLVTPSFTSVRQKATPGWMMEQFKMIKPSYVVLRAYEVSTNSFFASFDAPLFENEEERNWFDSHYAVERTFGEGKYAMVIYRRADIQSGCDAINRGGRFQMPQFL